MLGTILYFTWLLTPVIVFVTLTRARVAQAWRLRGTLAATVFAIPAYLGLFGLFSGSLWPPDIFFQKRDTPPSVLIAGYTVTYRQQWGLDLYETYFEITRSDGLKAYLEIDGDDNKCWEITTQTVGEKVYFLCDEKTVTPQTPYVNKVQKLLYIGINQCSRLIDDLPFKDYPGNPLVSRPESGDPELYCQ